jgi:hypothetical protein
MTARPDYLGVAECREDRESLEKWVDETIKILAPGPQYPAKREKIREVLCVLAGNAYNLGVSYERDRVEACLI